MKHEFKWDKENKELTELRTGDELVDNKQQKVDGRYINTTIYPEATARSMIIELERQLKDTNVQLAAMKETIAKMEKDFVPVDAPFMKKFKSCMARMGVEKQKEGMVNTQEQNVELNKQLAMLKETMGDDF